MTSTSTPHHKRGCLSRLVLCPLPFKSKRVAVLLVGLFYNRLAFFPMKVPILSVSTPTYFPFVRYSSPFIWIFIVRLASRLLHRFPLSAGSFFKSIVVRRLYDKEANNVVYVSYSSKLDAASDGNKSRFKSSLCAVHIE